MCWHELEQGGEVVSLVATWRGALLVDAGMRGQRWRRRGTEGGRLVRWGSCGDGVGSLLVEGKAVREEAGGVEVGSGRRWRGHAGVGWVPGRRKRGVGAGARGRSPADRGVAAGGVGVVEVEQLLKGCARAPRRRRGRSGSQAVEGGLPGPMGLAMDGEGERERSWMTLPSRTMATR